MTPSSAVISTRRNWPLILGMVIVALVIYLAANGHRLAAQDPLKENFIVQNPATGKFIKPPLPAFLLSDFPLGSDQYGRDILSQLLWGVRPTLTLVLLVAALRLVIGTAIGLMSGWSEKFLGRALDALISAALAAPVLFVALCLIAAVGIKWGVGAFVVGLSATGWAEVARLVREQTRGAKSQPFVESARALGASDGDILLRHILPQILPMLWMLLAFEISSTLLVTAGLGFLGYFTNSVWIPLGDWSGIRASGKPELGQMLATASQNAQTQPWGMFAAGTMIFMMVLGFNLLGEGLRRQLVPQRRRPTLTNQLLDTVTGVIEDRWFDPLSPWRRNLAYGVALGGLLTIIGGGAWGLWQTESAKLAHTTITVPGGHFWASELHDAQGTAWTEIAGPASGAIQWTFTDEAGFPGGPVVAADGTVYVAANSRTLYALNPDGSTRWKADLPAAPWGAPALTVDGDIIVLTHEGWVNDFTPQGQVRWAVQPEQKVLPLTSPVIDGNGTIYYTSEMSFIAVTLDGVVQWKKPIPTYSYVAPVLRLSADEQFVFFEDIAVDARTGGISFSETKDILDKYVIGTDGGLYLRQQSGMLRVKETEQGAEISEFARWDARALGLGFRFPREAGLTPDGRVWVLYASDFEFAKLVWLDQNKQPLSPTDYPYRPSRLIGFDENATAYLCGLRFESRVGGGRSSGGQCQAHRPGAGETVWETDLAGTPSGGALAPGRLYVTTTEGMVYAIGE